MIVGLGMNYSKMIGFPKPVFTALQGIGDAPMAPVSDGASMIIHRASNASMRGVKIDQHASFPKGLPKAFRLTDEHIRD